MDNNKSIAHYFGNLSINVHDDDKTEPTIELLYTESKKYYTSVCQMQNSESVTTVNALADNIFKYQIILSNKTIFFITLALYIFN